MSRLILDEVQKRLHPLVGANWAEREEEQGEKVKLYREYYEGKHRADMTPEMQKMLRLDNRTDEFNINYCEMVVESMTDRLKVSSIEAVLPEDTNPGADMTAVGNDGGRPDDPAQKNPAQKWVDNILAANRFDGLMLDSHDAAARDGDAFIMVEFSDKQTRMAFEPAYDGDFGTIVVYDRMRKNIEAAVKIWWESGYQYVNIYRPGHIERYQVKQIDPEDATAGTLSERVELDQRAEDGQVYRLTDEGFLVWADKGGDPLGVPVVPFHWNKTGRQEHGASAIAGMIPINDALNRNFYSMIMVTELTAFSILVSMGIDIPAGLTPGMSLTISLADVAAKVGGENAAAVMNSLDVKRLEPGSISPFIEQANFLITQIASVSRTPIRALSGADNQSGESLKQKESGLLGKIAKAQVRLGNSWEDAVAMAHKIETAFATTAPPPVLRFSCKWDDAEVRNDTEFTKSILDIKDLIGDREALRLIGKVHDYDENKVNEIMKEKAKQLDKVVGTPTQIEDFSNLVVPSVQPDAQPVNPLPVAVGQG